MRVPSPERRYFEGLESIAGVIAAYLPETGVAIEQSARSASAPQGAGDKED
jgi:hypothetical protein